MLLPSGLQTYPSMSQQLICNPDPIQPDIYSLGSTDYILFMFPKIMDL